MKSKTQLFKDLGELGYSEIAEQKLKHSKVANETYGKMSCIYLRLGDETIANKVKRQLSRLGHKIRSYGDETVVELQVSFFKGWHWDE
jgi:hypothetical protein